MTAFQILVHLVPEWSYNARIEQLRSEMGRPKPTRKSGRYLWANLRIDLSAEDIDEVRPEMWENFPRDDS